MRKNCSSDREKLLKFDPEGREFAKVLRSLEQFMRTVKGQNKMFANSRPSASNFKRFFQPLEHFFLTILVTKYHLYISLDAQPEIHILNGLLNT